MIFLQDIITLARDYLDEATASNSDWSDNELARYLAREQDFLSTKIRNYQQDFFVKRFTFVLVSGTIEYYLPRDVISLRFVENLTAGVTGTAPFFTVDEDDRTFEVVLPVHMDRISTVFPFDDVRRKYSRVSFERYVISGDRMIFVPGQNLTGHIRLWYTAHLPSLHYGTVSSATSTTIVLPSSPTVGQREYGDNRYEGMYLGIYSGSGVGEVKRITQYTESTRTVTVDTAWTTTPTSSSVYSIVSPIPEQMAELLALGGCIRARGKLEDSTDHQVMMYSGLSKEYMEEIDPRVKQGTRHARSV